LGYIDVGLDDAWQLCGVYGKQERYTYHDASSGAPIIDTSKFPNFNALTDHAHSLGLTAGWYGNNCICKDHCDTNECYEQDVKALINLGFDSIKLDNCGVQTDLQKWSDLIDKTGKTILIENCHWGETLPNATWCPFHYYRTSGDIRANYESVIDNLMTVVPLAKQQLSTPGCWAYPDMLEVGCDHGPGGPTDKGLTFTEARTHFGAWAIVSSPLILSHDMTNATITDTIWPIISNKEVIAVNQAYVGDSGNVFDESPDKVTFTRDVKTESVASSKNRLQLESTFRVAAWQQWSKQIDATTFATAVLLVNNDDIARSMRLNFASVPSLKTMPANSLYSLRDLYSHKELGTFTGSYDVSLETHDSIMLMITPV
jgi:alpha-galactosidase